MKKTQEVQQILFYLPFANLAFHVIPRTSKKTKVNVEQNYSCESSHLIRKHFRTALFFNFSLFSAVKHYYVEQTVLFNIQTAFLDPSLVSVDFCLLTFCWLIFDRYTRLYYNCQSSVMYGARGKKLKGWTKKRYKEISHFLWETEEMKSAWEEWGNSLKQLF